MGKEFAEKEEIIAALPVPSKIFSEAELLEELGKMVTPAGLQASANNLFRGAVFGRDSLWTARFLIEDKEIAHLALTSLARIQGKKHVPKRGEEPGKIAHEYRLAHDADANQDILSMFKKMYGEAIPGAYIIYTTVDATPLWIVLLGEYCERYGREILDERIPHVSGEEVSMFETLMRAASWIEKQVRNSEYGLLEAKRKNMNDHVEFPVLRDGKISYRHEDGSYPNLRRPIAYLEVQGYAYDALMYAAEVSKHTRPRKALGYRTLAKRLQSKVFELFWLSDRDTFAAALDRDPSDALRPLSTLSTVQPEILNSAIFDTLPQDEREKYITGVLKNFFTPEFQTPAGPRSISLKYAHLTEYYAYQGPETVWPVLAHLVARGLRRQGFAALAYDIAARMVNTVQAAGSPRELFYVMRGGEGVVLAPEECMSEGETLEICTTNHGEANQTWTIAAIIEAKRTILIDAPMPTAFEQELLGREVTSLWSEEELKNAFINRLKITLNLGKGREMEARLVAQICG